MESKPANEELKERLISEAISKHEIAGNDVYLKDIPTILRVGHHSGILECSKDFLLLPQKAQELMVFSTVNLAEYTLDTDMKYFGSDKKAFVQMMEKYPEETPTTLLALFTASLGDKATTRRNLRRIEKLVNFGA